MSAVAVIDYGVGNLLNVVRALAHCGADVTVIDGTRKADCLPDRLVLPGVGAFAVGMTEMRRRGLDDLTLRFAQTERPLLGICVGAQMLLEVGEEFGEHSGLGLIAGRVQPVPARAPNGRAVKIPHIGWSRLTVPAGRQSWSSTPLSSFPEDGAVYFVHSFAPVPTQESDRLADTYYDGVRICAAVGRGNLWGLQFHPERSGLLGLQVLRSFLSM